MTPERLASPWATDFVWLSNGAGQVAHSVDGVMTDELWATKCGLIIHRRRQFGALLQWQLLNHALVAPCKRCF